MSTRRAVRNRSRQRPGSFLEITRLLAQAVPYRIDSSRTIWTFGQGTLRLYPARYRSRFCNGANHGKSAMATKRITSVLLVILGMTSSAHAQRKEIPVDLIIRGGTVVTMDGSRRVIENGGIAIKDGRIVAVATAAEMELY